MSSAYEEARTLSLVGGVGPLKLKPTSYERIGHLYEAITNPEIVTSNVWRTKALILSNIIVMFSGNAEQPQAVANGGWEKGKWRESWHLVRIK